MARIYLICPVRAATPKQVELMTAYVQVLESRGHIVHFPHRDVDQHDRDVNICRRHRAAMFALGAYDEVHVWLDEGKTLSSGEHFDLGMAYMLDQFVAELKFVVVNGPLPQTTYKSFTNLLRSLTK